MEQWANSFAFSFKNIEKISSLANKKISRLNKECPGSGSLLHFDRPAPENNTSSFEMSTSTNTNNENKDFSNLKDILKGKDKYTHNSRSFKGNTKKLSARLYKTKLALENVNQMKLNLISMVETYPRGIPLDHVMDAYQRKFNEPILYEKRSRSLEAFIRSIYGLSIKKIDIADSQDPLILVTIKESPFKREEPISFDAENIPDPAPSKKNRVRYTFGESTLPKILLEEFQQLLDANDGWISLKKLEAVYKQTTYCTLDVEGLGYNSLFKLLQDLPQEFKLHSDGKNSALCLKGVVPKTQESPVSNGQQLSEETYNNLKKLLSEYFPGGLALTEINSAYNGLFGYATDGLSPVKYGYTDMLDLMTGNRSAVKIVLYQGQVWCADPKQSEENIIQEYPAGSAAEAHDLFVRLDREAIFSQEGGCVEVQIAEIYTPTKFWVIHSPTSETLHSLMDRLYEFYEGNIGKRYKATERDIQLNRPVVVKYPIDLNFYRALVLSREDLYSYKVFLVDYGTVFRANEASIWLMQKEFLGLPAQAVQVFLSGITPPDKKLTWLRSTSLWFEQRVQEKVMIAYVLELKPNVVEIYLYDNDGETNICEELIEKGLAVFKDTTNQGCSSSTPVKTNVSSANEKVLHHELPLKNEGVTRDSRNFREENRICQISSPENINAVDNKLVNSRSTDTQNILYQGKYKDDVISNVNECTHPYDEKQKNDQSLNNEVTDTHEISKHIHPVKKESNWNYGGDVDTSREISFHVTFGESFPDDDSRSLKEDEESDWKGDSTDRDSQNATCYTNSNRHMKSTCVQGNMIEMEGKADPESETMPSQVDMNETILQNDARVTISQNGPKYKNLDSNSKGAVSVSDTNGRVSLQTEFLSIEDLPHARTNTTLLEEEPVDHRSKVSEFRMEDGGFRSSYNDKEIDSLSSTGFINEAEDDDPAIIAISKSVSSTPIKQRIFIDFDEDSTSIDSKCKTPDTNVTLDSNSNSITAPFEKLKIDERYHRRSNLLNKALADIFTNQQS